MSKIFPFLYYRRIKHKLNIYLKHKPLLQRNRRYVSIENMTFIYPLYLKPYKNKKHIELYKPKVYISICRGKVHKYI